MRPERAVCTAQLALVPTPVQQPTPVLEFKDKLIISNVEAVVVVLRVQGLDDNMSGVNNPKLIVEGNYDAFKVVCRASVTYELHIVIKVLPLIDR